MQLAHCRRWLRLLGTLLVVSSCGRPDGAARVDDTLLVHADADTANWLMYGRTYDEQRFSPLSLINENSVKSLGLVWSRELGTTRGLEATPLVVDGVIYTTGSWSVVYAIDATSGQIRWTYDPLVSRARARTYCCDAVNRGVAIYRGKVFVGASTSSEPRDLALVLADDARCM